MPPPRSPVVKGKSGPVLVGTRYITDPGTGDRMFEWEYAGSALAIQGFTNSQSFKNENIDIRLENGMGRAYIRAANSNKGNADLVYRYEISTETLETEIWSHPSVIAEAAAYNLAVASQNGARTYRQLAEDVAESVDTTVNVSAATYPNWQTVVEMLRDGVTGWEKEYIVFRRTRRIPSNFVTTPSQLVANLGATSLIYSTAQLGLPAGLSFAVPDSDSLSPSSSLYTWGWRRRPSNITFDGSWIEQVGEFLLAEWATLFYTESASAASW